MGAGTGLDATAKVKMSPPLSGIALRSSSCHHRDDTEVAIPTLFRSVNLVSLFLLTNIPNVTTSELLAELIASSVWLRIGLSLFIFGRHSVRIKEKLRGFSPLANYTDRAIAAGQRS
jgi:hypothetical protein